MKKDIRLESENSINFYKFEDLSPSQLYDIFNLRLSVFVTEQKILYVDTDYYDQDADHWLFHNKGKLKSYARVIKPGKKYDFFSIGRVVTEKKSRNKGYSSRLINKIINHYKKDFIISAQYQLVNFYEKFGFKVDSKPYIEEGLKHVKMKLLYKVESH